MNDVLAAFILVCLALVGVGAFAFVLVLAVGLGLMAAEGVAAGFTRRRKARRKTGRSS